MGKLTCYGQTLDGRNRKSFSARLISSHLRIGRRRCGGGGGGGNEPANDSCQSPRVISSLPYQDELDTKNATSAADDPASCAGNQAQKTVWYSITPSVDTVYGIDTLASDYDTVVSVFTGACGSLTPVACNDNFENAAQLADSFFAYFCCKGWRVLSYRSEREGKRRHS